MSTWEAILEDYLEGAGSRAAAESLRFRIALPAEARQEVETVLRLADRLADATQSVRPPAGAAQRLGDRLLLAGLPDVRPNWVQEGSELVAPDGASRPGADEDAVNAAIEGASGLTTPLPTIEPGGPARDLTAFNEIAAAVRRESSAPDAAIPPGAIDRLRTKLAEAQERGEGGASSIVARRILAQLRGEATRPPAAVRPPDVLAAGEEPEDGEGPPKG